MIDRMIEALEILEPVELKGVEILRNLRSSQHVWFPGGEGALMADEDIPVSRAEAIQATLQLIDYGEKCRKLIGRIQSLEAVPLSVPLAEYPL